MNIRNVTTKILLAAICAMLSLALCLMLVMGYFMGSLTDSIMLGMLQPMTRTGAQNVENRLHTLAERFFLLRENHILRSTNLAARDKQESLTVVGASREYVWLGLYEPDGTLLAGGDTCPRTISGRMIFPQLKETKNLVIEPTTIDSSGPEIVMGVPVFADGSGDDARAEIAYYLVGSYSYDLISDVLRDINVGTNGTAFIIDRYGVIIGHKDLGKVFSQEPLLVSLGGGEAADELLAAMTQRQIGSARILMAGNEFFVGFSPIKGTMWALGILAPRDDFMGAAQQALLIGAALILVALVGTGLFVTLFNRRVLSLPLAAIASNARQLATGNFGAGLPPELVARRDEIGQLGEAFERMSASVRDVLQDIRTLTAATGSGNLAFRANLETYHGDFRRIVDSLNASLDGVCSYLDRMPDAMLLFDAVGGSLYHNMAMARILDRHGLSPDFHELVHAINAGNFADISQEALKPFDAAVSSPEKLEREISLHDASGQLFSYTLSLGRINGSNGSFCVMLVLNDVTQLAGARTQAEAANHAKSDFLSRMSHEMRTPMNAIIGMAAIGMGADSPERKQYCLNKIDGASQHLLGVINDILDMSKIEADKFELSESVFSPVHMLQRVIDVIRFQTDARRQSFIIDIDERLPAGVVADEQRMAQVVTNLLSNAVKFTPEEGSVTLRALLTARNADASTIHIAVSDTGIGMTEEQRLRLFKPFEQADGSISRKFGGTGLGLAISKRIMEKMGGSISVFSEPEQGSTFTLDFTVPNADPEAEACGASAPEISSSDAVGIFRGIKVLLAEDVEINREIAASLLEHTGVTLVFACDGQEAVAVFSSAPETFALILMDVQMPLVDGYEATGRIRASGLPNASTIPIIAMTANVFREDIERCLAAGMSGHLGKPIDADEVIAALARYLGKA